MTPIGAPRALTPVAAARCATAPRPLPVPRIGEADGGAVPPEEGDGEDEGEAEDDADYDAGSDVCILDGIVGELTGVP